MILRFRAWDKIDKEMIDVGKLILNGEQYSELDAVWGHNPYYEDIWISPKGKDNVLPIQEIEFMQYTGLKDKNGVEIYEGDVVKLNVPTYKTFTIVIYTLYEAFVLGKNVETSDYIEILGNIYENPELLEEQE